MDRRVRQVAGLLTALLLAVAASAGWIQGLRSEEIAAYEPEGKNGEQARNRFRIFQECRWERGPILSIDGRTLAESVRSQEGRRCLYERNYPTKDLAAHVVGQWSLHFDKSGLEEGYNQDLIGDPLPAETLADLFKQRPRVGNTLISTIDTRLQKEALKALAGRRGGIVALNPKTGAVYVAASNPSYDPNPLASNDRVAAEAAGCEVGLGEQRLSDGSLKKDENGDPISCEKLAPGAPLRSVALAARRPPGSTFKVVTAAAALESGKYNPDTGTKGGASYVPPGEAAQFDINNYGEGNCGGTLANALRVSCNTSFAQIAVDVGAERLYDTAQAMGFNQPAVGFVGCDGDRIGDIPGTRTGCLPMERKTATGVEKLETAGFRARAGFGQWVIQASPYGMAVAASTVANGGFVPRPRFAERVLDRRGELVREVRTGIGQSALSPEAAGQLAQMMRLVVSGGTAAGAFGGFRYEAAGKTGTADQPTCAPDEQAIFGAGCDRLAHAWFMGFAPVNDPSIAIAVLIERGGGLAQATGGRVAAPVARQVLDKFFDLYPAARGGGDDEDEDR